MSDINLVLIASILVSVSVMFGFACSWCMSGRLYGRRYNYLLLYALYMALSNMPKLLLTFAGVPIHRLVWTFLDVVGLLILFIAAENWRPGGIRPWHWLVFLIGIAFSIAHHIAGERVFAAGYSLSVLAVLIITLYNIASQSPPLVSVLVGASFAGWTLVTLIFPHTGNVVGHAFGMATKVIVFGSVTVAHYERQHRKIWQAARVRSLAIDIVAESFTNARLVGNGRQAGRLDPVRGSTTLD